MRIVGMTCFSLLMLTHAAFLPGCRNMSPVPPDQFQAGRNVKDEVVELALKTIGSLRSEINTLLPQKARMAEEISRLQADSGDQRKLLASLKDQRTELLDKYAKLESANQLLAQKQEALQAVLNKKTAELSELRYANERLSSHDPVKTYGALREQNAWMKKKLEEFRYHLMKEQSNVAMLQDSLAQVEKEQETIEGSLAQRDREGSAQPLSPGSGDPLGLSHDLAFADAAHGHQDIDATDNVRPPHRAGAESRGEPGKAAGSAYENQLLAYLAGGFVLGVTGMALVLLLFMFMKHFAVKEKMSLMDARIKALSDAAYAPVETVEEAPASSIAVKEDEASESEAVIQEVPREEGCEEENDEQTIEALLSSPEVQPDAEQPEEPTPVMGEAEQEVEGGCQAGPASEDTMALDVSAEIDGSTPEAPLDTLDGILNDIKQCENNLAVEEVDNQTEMLCVLDQFPFKHKNAQDFEAEIERQLDPAPDASQESSEKDEQPPATECVQTDLLEKDGGLKTQHISIYPPVPDHDKEETIPG